MILHAKSEPIYVSMQKIRCMCIVAAFCIIIKKMLWLVWTVGYWAVARRDHMGGARMHFMHSTAGGGDAISCRVGTVEHPASSSLMRCSAPLLSSSLSLPLLSLLLSARTSSPLTWPCKRHCPVH